MLTVTAYAATAPDSPLEKTTIARRDLGPLDVLIEIRYAGICHSDIHTARDEWGGTRYPVVPGHEIAGVVTDIGPEVTLHEVGDRVGVGCMVDSCGTCEPCVDGEEQYCDTRTVFTYNSIGPDGQPTHGGYSTHIVVTEGFVVSIPDSLGLDVAAPLLCAGVTTYSPLRHWGVGPGSRVAVVGMGGLGHVAVKIAHAMGADVTVLSQSLSKRDDGIRFGADDYRATADRAVFTELRGSFDLILNTVSADLDLNAYLGLLALDGTLVMLGLPEESVSVSGFSLTGKRRSLAGSNIGGIRETQDMLDFCADHAITAEVEVIAAERINEAYERVVRSDVRYRFVIDAATF